nr:hypothetical protein [Longispora sp. (in: high G+C Gram-positive bacteria)]
MSDNIGATPGRAPLSSSGPQGQVGRREQMWDRVAGIAGLLFVALILASFFTPEYPDLDDSADDIAAQLTADRSTHLTTLFLGIFGFLFLAVFISGLWSRFRRWEGFAGMFATLFLVGGTALLAGFIVNDGISLAYIQYGSSDNPDPGALRALAVLVEWVFGALLSAFATMFLGAAGVILT